MRFYFLMLGTMLLVCVGCAVDGQQIIDRNEYVAPPAAMLQQRGPMVDGPGPAVMAPLAPMGMVGGPGMAPGPYGPPMMGGAPVAPKQTQVRFVGPDGMHIGWVANGAFAESQVIAPGRYSFNQGMAYQLKLANIPNREDGLMLYPTLEVYPAHPTTDSFLAHNTVPVQITDEDLDQVQTGNHVTKVIYLPEPKFQELAVAGVETLVSTVLDPGVDAVAEADRRGTIMAVLRMGDKDLEMPNGAGGGAGLNTASGAGETGIQQTSYVVDGTKGEQVAPQPIFPVGSQTGVPMPQMMGGPSYPGRPPYNAILSQYGGPKWGMPITATPIGLPGPPHLPLGGPASLKSHTIRNNTKMDLGKPVEHMLIDVGHKPGYKMPHPVSYVKYTEEHPLYSEGEVSNPAWAGGGGGSQWLTPQWATPQQ